MAITGNYSTNTGVNLNLKAYYSYEQNISANTSTVTVTLKAHHNKLYANALSGSYLSVAGNKSNYSANISHSSSTTTETTLASKVVTITHNDSGAATCNIRGTFVFNGTYGGTYIGTLSINETLTLQSIARASTITKITNSAGTTISEINSGEIVRIYWTPALSTYKYRLQFIVAGTTYTYPSVSTYFSPNSVSQYSTAASGASAITTSHSWIPNDTSDTVIVKLFTYNSSNVQIGNPQQSTFSLNIPETILPNITSFTATVVDGYSNCYVREKSKVQLSVNVTPGAGTSGMSYYIFSGKNITSNASYRKVTTTGTSCTVISDILSYEGLSNYAITVCDARGRIASQSLPLQFTVYPYTKPAIASITVQRCTSNGTINANGTYALVSVSSSFASINGNNTRTVSLSSSINNYATETLIQDTTDSEGRYLGVYGGSFTLGTNYTIKATIIDTAYHQSANKSAILTVAERPLNVATYGKGVAIGGMSSISSAASDGLFENYWDGIFYEDLYVGSARTVANKISGIAKCATSMESGDLNTLYASGIYTVAPIVANTPDDVDFTVIVFPYSLSSTTEATNRYMVQMALTAGAITTNAMYIRHSYNTAQWTAWTRVLDDTVLANYLPTSGGTITGSLRLNNAILFPTEGASLRVSNNLMSSGSSYGRTIEMGNDAGAGDRYYLQVDSNSNLKLGVQVNNAPSVSWLNVANPSIRRGRCTLNSSTETTVSFTSALPGSPTVMLTPITSTGGVIAAKVRSVASSYFRAIIGGSITGSIEFMYLAVYD